MKVITDAANRSIEEPRLITDPTTTITTIHQLICIIRIIRIIPTEAIIVSILIAPIGIAVIIGITVENLVAIIVTAGLDQAALTKIVTRTTGKNVRVNTAADRIKCWNQEPCL